MFDKRAASREWMDVPDFGEPQARRSFRFIRVVNRFFGGIRVVRRFFAAELRNAPRNRPLTVLDLGSGVCDIPLAVSRWAHRQGLRIHFTCIESNPHAYALAKRSLSRSPHLPIRLLRQDAFEHFSDEPYDWAVASMFCHHLDEGSIRALVSKLRGLVREGLLVNDLVRSFWAYAACALLAAPAPADVRHDALLSVRKGFRPHEWPQWLSGLHDISVEAHCELFFRIAAVVRFPTPITRSKVPGTAP